MLILLPPSEGKTAPSRGKSLDLTALSSPALTAPRAQLLSALVTLCRDRPADAAAALGLGHSQEDLIARNATLPDEPTARADAVYTGVLFDALDVTSLSAAARRRATSRVAVTSALFGLVRPDDRIPAYRLSGDTTLPGVGGVASVWRRHLGAAITEALGGGLLVDLRSGTYGAFWRSDLPERTATVRVLHEVDGTRKVVSHFNKATKGRIVRALLEDGANPRTPTQLAETLRRLGWQVEAHEPGARGTQLDVVVTEV